MVRWGILQKQNPIFDASQKYNLSFLSFSDIDKNREMEAPSEWPGMGEVGVYGDRVEWVVAQTRAGMRWERPAPSTRNWTAMMSTRGWNRVGYRDMVGPRKRSTVEASSWYKVSR